MVKVAVWGKFEGLHEGHLSFLDYAKSLGDELYVIVIPDDAIKVNEGRNSRSSVADRLNAISSLPIVTKSWSGEFPETLDILIKAGVDYFVFGYDQSIIWRDKLVSYLTSKGVNPKYITAPSFNQGIHNRNLRRM